MGKSPLLTAHWTFVKSPELRGSSPKLKGFICGDTVDKYEVIILVNDDKIWSLPYI